MVSLCSDCGQDRLTSSGCSKKHILIHGSTYKRMVGAFTSGTTFTKKIESLDARCNTCGAKDGYVHHAGCEDELCPIHKTPLISCDCDEAVPVI